MAKKKVETKKNEETFDEKLAKVSFEDKTIADVYEAEVCLALKLDALIDIMQKMYDLAEAKRTGTMSIN